MQCVAVAGDDKYPVAGRVTLGGQCGDDVVGLEPGFGQCGDAERKVCRETSNAAAMWVGASSRIRLISIAVNP